jgi:hypothetical protein
LGFLVWKQTIWQPWFGTGKTIVLYVPSDMLVGGEEFGEGGRGRGRAHRLNLAWKRFYTCGDTKAWFSHGQQWNTAGSIFSSKTNTYLGWVCWKKIHRYLLWISVTRLGEIWAIFFDIGSRVARWYIFKPKISIWGNYGEP